MRLLIFFLFLATACTSNYTPKPKGYNRLDLPPHAYRASPDSLSFAFEYSRHATIRPYRSGLAKKSWIEIHYPTLKANIHLTYKPIGDARRLRDLMDDAYELTSKQQIKAYAIDEMVSKTPSGKTALIAEITGEVPTQLQFTMTDSVSHFLRGALYFNQQIQNDSLAPAIDYMKREVMHFINTVEWK